MKQLLITLVIIISIVVTSCASAPARAKTLPPQVIDTVPAPEAEQITQTDSEMSEELFQWEQEAPQNVPTECSYEISNEEQAEAPTAVYDAEATPKAVEEEPPAQVYSDSSEDYAMIAGNVFPKWFCGMGAGLMLAFFFTICFVARQIRFSRGRKE